jgi:hypothetical protein
MNSLLFLFAASSVGVDYGWQPNQDGEIEYIIQIEPELLESLRIGTEITSRVDPQVQGVRRFRIRVGNGTPPRLGSTTSPADQRQNNPDKVANDGSDSAGNQDSRINANIPPYQFDNHADKQPIGAKLQPPPLLTPDRLNTKGGGAFNLESGGHTSPKDLPAEKGDFRNDSYVPLKESPIDSSENGPIPDPDSASRQPGVSDDTSHLALQPRKLEPPLSGEPLPGQQASYDKTVAEQTAAEHSSPSDIPIPAEEESSRPWKTLVMICLMLFASVGLNVYLGWIARGIYVRYRTLSMEAHDHRAATT